MLVIFGLHQDADTTFPVTNVPTVLAKPLFPNDAEEQWTGRVHDRDIRQTPGAVVALQTFNHFEEERVLAHGTHSIVGDASRFCATHPRGVGQKRIEPTIAAIV